ncbi:hypothetical protein ISN45_At03g034030, partial [Arabidopsis thaliana x Arabidopsis arenosa]
MAPLRKRGRVTNQRANRVDDAPAKGQAQPPIQGIRGMFEELINRIPQAAPAPAPAAQPPQENVLPQQPQPPPPPPPLPAQMAGPAI